MADIEQLRVLAERLENATGPDRKMDAEIDATLCGGFPAHLCHDRTRCSYGAEYIHNADDGSNLTQGGRVAAALTASVDAALALVERLLPRHRFELIEYRASGHVFACNILGMWSGVYQSHGPTAALAILRALVAALIAQAEATHG